MGTKIKQILKKVMTLWYKFRAKIHIKRKEKMTQEQAIVNIDNSGYMPKKYTFDREITNECLYDLSLIIPVYNAEKYLKLCIDSLINQKTSYSYELVFINDGSTDKSLKILQSFLHHSNVKVITQENQGISAARNRGIGEARGEYIGFIDNDDYVSEDYVQTLLQAAKNENADIVKAACVEFDNDTNKILRKFYNKTNVNVIDGYMGTQVFDYDGFIWGGVYRKSIFNSVRFPIGFWYEDMVVSFLVYRMSKKFVYLPKELYFKREHQNNAAKKIWNSQNIKCLDQFYLLKECVEFNDKIGLPHDETLLRLIYRECSFMLGHRTFGLDKTIRKSVFVLASELCKENYIKEYDLFSKALNLKDYRLWSYATLIKKLDY